MILGDLIYNDDFDLNCNYAVYALKQGEGITWHEVEPVWDAATQKWSKPPCALLDKKIQYVTMDLQKKRIVIEVEEEN